MKNVLLDKTNLNSDVNQVETTFKALNQLLQVIEAEIKEKPDPLEVMDLISKNAAADQMILSRITMKAESKFAGKNYDGSARRLLLETIRNLLHRIKITNLFRESTSVGDNGLLKFKSGYKQAIESRHTYDVKPFASAYRQAEKIADTYNHSADLFKVARKIGYPDGITRGNTGLGKYAVDENYFLLLLRSHMINNN